MRARLTALGLAVWGVLGGVPAVRAVTIAELLASPEPYDGTTVTVTGTVAVAVPVGTESGFDLRDGPAAITVVSRGGAPAAGAHLAVTGKVRVFHEDDSGREANTFPPVLVETLRQAAP